jgi:hypothetical protein
MPRRAKSRIKRLKKVATKTIKATRKKLTRAGKRTRKTLTKAGKSGTRRALRGFKSTRKKTAKALKAAKRFRKSANKSLRAAGKRLKKYRRDRARQRKQLAAKQRSELRTQKREFGRLVLVGEQLSEEFQKGMPAQDPGASFPGQPPRMRTGKGRQSITVELRMSRGKPEGRVFVDKKIAPYMAMWEYRKDGKARPFLKPAVVDNLQEYGNQAIREAKRVPTGAKRKAVVR